MKTKKNILSFAIILLIIQSNLFSSSIDGTSSVKYLTANQVFHNGEYARGYVSFKSGATILSNAIASFNTQEPFTGGLDLRSTGTLSLEGDLILDLNFSLSGSGVISGNGKTIFLNENLTIPDNSVIHISTNTAIDGQGKNLVFGRRGKIFVDANITLTLRNLSIIQNFNNPTDPCLRLAALTSKLALYNVEMDLSQDFLFPQGQLFIHGDVAITGTSAFIYQSTQPSFITSGATLAFAQNTTFDFSPPTGGTPQLLAKDFLMMQDATSKLILDSCSLKTTSTGLRLTKGQIVFDNKVTVSSTSFTFGNASLGANYDALVKLLAGSNVFINGFVNYDCVI